MFDIAVNEDAKVCGWVQDQYQVRFLPPLTAIGITRHGQIVGAAVFNNFEGSNIELSCLGKGAFPRSICRLLARTAFEVNGCERVTIRVRADNAYVLKLAGKFGWVMEGVLRKYYGNVDCVVFGMLKAECRFLR